MVPKLRAPLPINACQEELKCGHKCGGCKGEYHHLDCLEPECREAGQITNNEVCIVCQDTLKNGPAIKLGCGHYFHATCIRDLLRSRWSTLRITFNFLKCPSCTADIDGISHVREVFVEQIPMRKLKRTIGDAALKKVQQDSMMNEERIACPLDTYYKQPVAYSMFRSEYYECKNCHSAFFGGYIDCAMERGFESPQAAALEEADLICRACQLSQLGIKEQFMCKKHGLDHIQFKCDLCCNLAQYHGRANSYLCQECYDDPMRITKFNCGGSKTKCPLDRKHLIGVRSVAVGGCYICVSYEDRGRVQKKSHEETLIERAYAETEKNAQEIISTKIDAKRHIESAKRTRDFAAAGSYSSIDT